MTSTSTRETTAEPDAARSLRLFGTLIGLAALAVLVQGLWAGIFLEHDGERDAAGKWINVHARGAEVALALAALATVVAFVKLRQRKDLWIGSAALTVLIVLESYLGGLIRDQSKDTLTAVHVPLAMALMGLAVWLPFQATRPAPDRPGRVVTVPGQQTRVDNHPTPARGDTQARS
jgi:Cytochrome oxidase assembly protein.